MSYLKEGSSLSLLSLVDYFLIRKALVKVSNVLLIDKKSIYWFHKGFNLRAAVTVLATIWVPLRESSPGDRMRVLFKTLGLKGV